MKTTKLKLSVIACIVVFGITNCTNSPKQKADKLEDAQENLINAENDLQEAVLDSTNEYDRYKFESETKLQENDLKIAELKAKMRADKIEIRTKYEKQLSELEQKNSKLKTNIADYKESDKNKWEKFKKDFNQEMDELGKSISRMAENNQKDN